MTKKEQLELAIRAGHLAHSAMHLAGVSHSSTAKLVVHEIATEVMNIDKWLETIEEGNDA